MIRRFMILGAAVSCSASALFTAGAWAQSDELSELDELSRGADDPFAGMIEQTRREPVSVTLRALDKITARTVDVEIAMHDIARFGSLELQARYCDQRPPEEFPEVTAFLEIFDTEHGDRDADLKIDRALLERDSAQSASNASSAPAPAREDAPLALEEIPTFGEASQEDDGETPTRALARPTGPPPPPAPEVTNGPQAQGENIFRGWMFASSPALNALEHPVYDVWVISCETRAVES